MKKIIFKISIVIFFLSGIIVSCDNNSDESSRKDLFEKKTNSMNTLNSIYKLNSGLKKELTSFSHIFNISEIEIKDIDSNSWNIYVSRIDAQGAVNIENFQVESLDNELSIKFLDFNKNLYSIKKDLKKEESFFIKDGTEQIIDEKFVEKIDDNDDYYLKRLIGIYIELYDLTLERTLNSNSYDCSQYVHGFGFTKSVAEERVNDAKDTFIKTGNNGKNCKTLGDGKPDTSCFGFTTHLCWSTISFRCKGGSSSCPE